jgi:hypothetical protein
VPRPQTESLRHVESTAEPRQEDSGLLNNYVALAHGLRQRRCRDGDPHPALRGACGQCELFADRCDPGQSDHQRQR